MPEKSGVNQVFMAFDYGKRRTGVAIGQSLTLTARPLTTISSTYQQPDWNTIIRLITEWQPQIIIVGIPEASEENRTLRKNIRQFCDQLSQKSHLPVTTHDETLTSDEAYHRLKAQRPVTHGKIRKDEIDQLAAAILLESWMNVNLAK